MSGICQQIFTLVKNNQIIEADTDLDDFVNLIYKHGEQRLEILMWMISKLRDINWSFQSEGAHIDVAKKLSDLQFVKSSDKVAFVKAELPVKRQEEVFNKIFKGLLSIQFLQSKTKPVHSFKDNFKIQPRLRKTKFVKGKKPVKSLKNQQNPVNLNAARSNIKGAEISVQCINSLKKEMQLTEELQLESNENDKNQDIPEISNLQTNFSACFSNLQVSPSYSCRVSEVVKAELEKPVEQLYRVLQAFNRISEKLPSEQDLRIKKKHSFRKSFEDIDYVQKTSVILQLNHLYSSTVK